MRNEDSLATILLSAHLGGDVAPLKAAELWELCERVGSPGSLLGASHAELVMWLGGDDTRARDAAALLARGTAVAFELDRLESSGVATLTPFDDTYPQRLVTRLGPKAPPVLHVAGPPGVLTATGIGIVGRRGLDVAEAEVARTLAERAVADAFAVVTGDGPGVDRAVTEAALGVEGTVVGVLAGPLTATLRRPDIRRAILEGRAVMCTPYGTDARYSAAGALGRDRVIHALAELTVVVSADVEGGEAWTGAVDALDAGVGPPAVWRGAGEGPGNGALAGRGAVPVWSTDDVIAAVRAALPPATEHPDRPPATEHPDRRRTSRSPDPPHQASLFDDGDSIR